ncbi:MAG: ATP-binding cassette domain-containing protein [Methanomicrobiaceae archaeon]|nr:ATP-binding cassette domain-containing protein [Methanomicrobiaceae archaeon]
MSDAIIEVRNLSHAYGDVLAVDNISFSVNRGEIFAFLGPNGAGKSTVINVLITLLSIQAGEVSIAGHDVRTAPDMVRRAIGIVFQEVTLDRDMTVREILEFHGRLYNLPREERRARIEELLALVELEAKRDARTKELSGGMKRRLEIARGLMTRPQVLFLDEPTIGLDPQTRIRMWDYLREVNRTGTTIFLTTHYMDEADHLSNRISIIDNGRIIVTGTPLALKNGLGEDVMYMETSDTAGTEDVLRNLAYVRDVRQKRNGTVFTVTEDGTRLLPAIMDDVRQRGIAVTAVNLKKPSMDDVFVHYTGRDLRDEGARKWGAGRGRSR